MNPEIRLVSKGIPGSMVGAALTVKARPGDNLLIHKALDMAGPGDVVVVSNEGDRGRALAGEVMVTHAEYRGIPGIVFDGPIRDMDVLKDSNLFLYATGSTPGGPFKFGPGEINVPIACGGITVVPGDLIIGDPDGVIVVPRSDAEEILSQAKEFAQKDQAKVAKAREGKLDRAWVERALGEKGCEIIDGEYPG